MRIAFIILFGVEGVKAKARTSTSDSRSSHQTSSEDHEVSTYAQSMKTHPSFFFLFVFASCCQCFVSCRPYTTRLVALGNGKLGHLSIKVNIGIDCK